MSRRTVRRARLPGPLRTNAVSRRLLTVRPSPRGSAIDAEDPPVTEVSASARPSLPSCSQSPATPNPGGQQVLRFALGVYYSARP
jgi:hypothetical protein